jgi:competence CoiA-like predicted nuclease
MKYNGAKESRKHKELKDYIYHCLIYDSRFSSVRKEKTINSTGIQKEWKRPDVSSIFCGDKKLVFEIQLSTTYLNVIVERESFYRDESIFILWVFNQFDIRRFTEKDIYYANKCNAFVIDKKTKAKSKQQGELIFRCYYKSPYISDGEIQYKWNQRLVTFDDLCFDSETFKVYYFDLDQEEEKIRQELLVKDFEQFWLTRTDCDWEKRLLLESEFCNKFSNNEIYLDGFNEPLERILDALYSVKFGKMIGYKFQNFISLANNILEYRKEFTKVFLWGLAVYERKEEVLNSDKKGKFRQKVARYKDGIKNSDPAYKQEKKYDVLFSILFPELREHLKRH